jgi:hypothetical protein
MFSIYMFPAGYMQHAKGPRGLPLELGGPGRRSRHHGQHMQITNNLQALRQHLRSHNRTQKAAGKACIAVGVGLSLLSLIRSLRRRRVRSFTSLLRGVISICPSSSSAAQDVAAELCCYRL